MSCWLDWTNTSISATIDPLIMTSVVACNDGWYWLQWDAADDTVVVERFCCSHLPSQLTSSSNEALIIFQSNMSSVSTTERRGFQLGYSTGDYDILHTHRLATLHLPLPSYYSHMYFVLCVFVLCFFCVWTFINCILIVSLCDCHTHSLKATWLRLDLFQPMWSQSTNVTDRQTRRHAIAIPRFALKCIAR